MIWGIGLQFVFGLVILRWSVGQHIFSCLGNKISRFLQFADKGTVFVFGEKLILDYKVFAFKVRFDRHVLNFNNDKVSISGYSVKISLSH